MSIFQVGWSLKMSTDKQVLAIKYRPQVFEELVGQNIIVEAIQKSISLDKIPNPFLQIPHPTKIYTLSLIIVFLTKT